MKMNAMQTVLLLLLLTSVVIGIGFSVPYQEEKKVVIPGDGIRKNIGLYLDVMKGQEVDVSFSTNSPITVIFQYTLTFQSSLISKSEQAIVNDTATFHLKFPQHAVGVIYVLSFPKSASVSVELIQRGIPQNVVDLVITSFVVFMIALFPFRRQKSIFQDKLLRGGATSERDIVLQTSLVFSHSLFVWGSLLSLILLVFNVIKYGSTLASSSDTPLSSRELYYIVFNTMFEDFRFFVSLAVSLILLKDIIDRFRREEITERSLSLSFRTIFFARSLTISVLIYVPLLVVYFVKYILISSYSNFLLIQALLAFIPVSLVLLLLVIFLYEFLGSATLRVILLLTFMNYLLLYPEYTFSTVFGMQLFMLSSEEIPPISVSSFLITIYIRTLFFLVVMWFLSREDVYMNVMKASFRLSRIIRRRVNRMIEKIVDVI